MRVGLPDACVGDDYMIASYGNIVIMLFALGCEQSFTLNVYCFKGWLLITL